jgi:hypothetical protein
VRGAGPRDATRGGVNVAAPPRQRGRERPLEKDGERMILRLAEMVVGEIREALGLPT